MEEKGNDLRVRVPKVKGLAGSFGRSTDIRLLMEEKAAERGR